MAFKKPRSKKKVCYFCKNKAAVVDFKDVDLLSKYVSPNGKISPRRVTGACARHQREVAIAIKRARQVALLPYVRD